MDKRRMTITFLIVLTNAMGATAILPMLPIYAERQFQATPVQALLVIPAYYAAQLLASPWLGTWSDRWGRRPVLIVSQIGTILSYLLFIFAIPLGDSLGTVLGISGGLVMIYLARLLDGLTGGNVSVAEAYASDISREESRARALGLIGGAVGLGHILGPVLTVTLSGVSLLAPLLGALVFSGAALLLTILFLTESLTAGQRVQKKAETGGSVIHLLRDNRLASLVITTAFIIGLYIATLLSSFSLYAERVLFPGQPANLVVRNVSLLVIASGVIAAASQIFLVGPLVKRFGEGRLVITGSALLLASALGISSGSLALVLAAVVLYALGYAMSWPSLQAILTHFSSSKSAGGLLGLFQSAFSLSFILSPLLAGILLEETGPRSIFQGGALLMALATLLGVQLLRLPSRIRVSTPGELSSNPHRPHLDRAEENSAD